MAITEAPGLFAGAIVLGFVHGVEPGHGWPVAASYALDQSNKWLHGFAASFLLGFGHLVSSIAMVLVFWWATEYFEITQIGWMNYVAGVLLIALGIREYFHGHSHDHGEGHSHGDGTHSHDHEGGDHSHADEHSHENPKLVGFGENLPGPHGTEHVHEGHDEHEHDHGEGHSHSNGTHSHDHTDSDHHHGGSVLGPILSFIPFVGGHSHDHDHGSMEEATDRGLLGIAGFAFVLGFAHEEEFEIIAICSATDYCLEAMTVYALTVIVGIVGLTLLLIAGYTHYEERVERYTDYLPLFSATVLILMGIGFIVGVF